MWQRYLEHSLQILITLFISAMLALTLVYAMPILTPLLTRLDRQIYDLDVRQALQTEHATLDPAVVLVDFDDSTTAQRPWPWNYQDIATLIEQVGKQQPSLIVLHEVFDKAQDHPIDVLKASLPKSERYLVDILSDPLEKGDVNGFYNVYQRLDENERLTQALNQYHVVLGFMFHQQPNKGIKLESETLVDGVPLPYKDLKPTWQANGYTANTSKVQKADNGEGHLTLVADEDGVVRNLPLFLQYNDHLYPSITLRAAQRYLFATDYYFLGDDYQIDTTSTPFGRVYNGIKLQESFIPTDEYGQMLIPYQLAQQPFTHISAINFLNKDTPDIEIPNLKGAIVMIGASASLLNSYKSTPIRANMSNFEIQGYALQGILHPDKVWYRPYWTNLAIGAQLLLLTLLILWWYPLSRPHTLLLLGAGLIAAILLGNTLVRYYYQAYLPIVTQLVLVTLSTLAFLVSALFRESRNRTQLQHMFGQYVPEEHIQTMLNQPKSINFDGERREMTVLFADLHNFTELSERLNTQDLKRFLNRYLTPATEIIFQHRGTIDKYIGDLIMAFWGAPLPNTAHAQDAVQSALALQCMLADKKEEFLALGVTSVKLGIGINTGFMNVGEMGSDYRRAYTVLGDSVNLAARLEPLTRFYEIDILVSEHTQQQCPDLVFRTIDRVTVKGKKQSVTLFQPLCHQQEREHNNWLWLTWHERAVAAYWQRDWTQASQLFHTVLQHKADDALAQLYLQRIVNLQQQTSLSDWNGVYEHQQKYH